MGVGSEGDPKGTGETEIGQLQVAVSVDQEVLRLQVAVENPVGVAEPNAIAELAHELLDNGGSQSQLRQLGVGALGQGPAAAAVRDWQRLHVFLEVEVEELEDEVELVTVGVYDVKQADYVGVTHLLEQRDLPDGCGGDALIFGLESDLLQCDDPVVVEEITSFVDNTIRSWKMQSRVSKRSAAAPGGRQPAMVGWWFCTYPLRSSPVSGSSPSCLYSCFTESAK